MLSDNMCCIRSSWCGRLLKFHFGPPRAPFGYLSCLTKQQLAKILPTVITLVIASSIRPGQVDESVNHPCIIRARVCLCPNHVNICLLVSSGLVISTLVADRFQFLACCVTFVKLIDQKLNIECQSVEVLTTRAQGACGVFPSLLSLVHRRSFTFPSR